jgi:hypothetical protein
MAWNDDIGARLGVLFRSLLLVGKEESIRASAFRRKVSAELASGARIRTRYNSRVARN